MEKDFDNWNNLKKLIHKEDLEKIKNLFIVLFS